MVCVSELERSGNRLPRKTREERAYRLVLASGAFGTIAVVTFVLALVGVMGLGPPLIAAIIAGVCFLLFRRTVSG
jgi:hypothetical protein